MEPLKPESIFHGLINPPFPTVEMMRKGKINYESPLGSLGETREVGRRKSNITMWLQQYWSLDALFEALSPSLLQSHAESLSFLPHSAPTQYSTYVARQHLSGTNPDDLFELDLNPDF
jgi:hypothetical protein